MNWTGSFDHATRQSDSPLVKLAGKLFAAVWCATVLTHAADQPPLTHGLMGVANGCFVETVAFLDAWHEQMGDAAWARMLRWGAREEEEVVAGHAVAVCEARGQLWCYDINFGWTPLAADAARKDDVTEIVTPILTRYPKIKAQFPSYFADFPQVPSATPPAAQPGNLNPAVRDATIAGERLARQRPVNVVTFTWGEGEQRRAGAATVFVFAGRYCLYTPEKGTVPFRARGGVENLRLIRELLLRMFPGVLDVTRL